MHYVTASEIERRLPWVLDSPSDKGTVELIVVRPHTDQRESCAQALFSPSDGVLGDNWKTQCWKTLPSGQAHPDVQVAIMNARMIDVLSRDRAQWALAGDQLFVDFDLSVVNLTPGDRLRVGAVTLEITVEPHRGCQKFRQRFGDAALDCVNSSQGDNHRLRGIYAKIISAGEVRVGDVIGKC